MTYEVGVGTISNDNALAQTSSHLSTAESWIYSEISNYNALFLEDSTKFESANVDIDVFGESNYIIASASDVEESGSGYFLYLKKDIQVVKVPLNELLDKVAIDCSLENINPILIVADNGTILGSNPSYLTNNFITVLSKSNDEALVNKCIEGLASDEVFTIELDILVGDNNEIDAYMAIKDFMGFNLVRVVDKTLVTQFSSNLSKLRFAYIGGISLVLILFAVVLILLIKKLIKSSGIDAGVNTKTANIVLIAKSNGRIVKYNKSFKVAFPNHIVPIKSLAELNLVKGINLVDAIKAQKAFVLEYVPPVDENGEKVEENVYFEFMSLKRSGDYSIVGRVITEEYNNEQILISSSTKSAVTADDNAIVLDRCYREAKAKYKAVGDPYLLLITNLKGFKNVNTLLGFKAGNDVLAFFSNVLHQIYEGYHVFHIGADEFVLLTTEHNEADAMMKTDTLINELKAPIEINNNEIMLRPAVGLLGSDMDGDCETTHDMLIDKLRIACERAKNSAGRMVAKYDTNLENAAQKDREMEEDLKQAIAKNEFVMFYQPQYEINQERVCGFEALLRWNNPKYAGISPQVYIELAEKNGFIIDVGNFITKDVLKTAKEMEQYDIHISVNVSPAQIVQAGFVADLLDEFEKNNLQPGSIAVEVTETFLMENFQTVVEKLKILKNRGISVHLDDFGTGYSSMLYLKELPIDTIKVDKEFIKHIETDRFSKVLTSKIISLAKELGDKVICEGVETKIQKDIVAKFGADIIQGYYIGKALSKEDAFALLKTGKVASENKTSGKAGGN
ncbi:MAG: putative bifunctional diguanylate cyclase/phosphodiesterase [Anaeroplasmataceae bacterium]